MWRFNGSVIRQRLPSTGSPAGRASPASTVLHAAPTSRRPSRRASLPSLGGTRLVPVFVPDRAEHARGRPGAEFFPVVPDPDFVDGKRRDLPRSWRTPVCTCPALRPRWDRNRQTDYGGPMLPSVQCGRRRLPRIVLLRGSITQPAHSLSTLRRAGRPNPTQDSLPAAGQLCRAGLVTCRVPAKGFLPMVYGPTVQSSFPRLFVAHPHSGHRPLTLPVRLYPQAAHRPRRRR